jgi:putative flippase GtrA
MSTHKLDAGLLKQSFRFAVTGGLNTAIGFSIILALLFAGANDYVANVGGYVAGFFISFFINRRWTFEQKQAPSWNEAGLFGMAFLISYSANLAIIFCARSFGLYDNWLVHLAGVAVYSVCFLMLSRNFVYNGNPSMVSQYLPRRYIPETLIIAVALICTPLLLLLNLTHDVSWQFWIARQMVHGVPLYERIMEINPPLWFWMAMPLVEIAEYIPVQADRLYIIAIILLSLYSALVTGRFLKPDDAAKRFAIMAALLAFFWIGPLYDFGQREQLTIILTLPYCALIFKRQQNEPVPNALALFIGISAAAGFALKHYFVLVPVALEIWFLWHLRGPYLKRISGAFRIETIALALCAACYVAAILIFHPAFLSKIVPLVSASYIGYESPFITQLFRVEIVIWVFVLASMKAMRAKVGQRDQSIGDVLAIAGVAFCASYFLQQKGWQYHAIPGTVCLALLGFHYLINQRELPKAIIAYPAAFLAILLFVMTGVTRGPYNSEWAKNMEQHFAEMHRGNSMMILTTDPRRVFPFVEQYQVKWPSRYFSFWMISAISKAENGSGLGKPVPMTPALRQLSVDIRRETLEDMKCHTPEILLSQIRTGNYSITPKRFRMTDFFRRDPDLKDYIARNYRLEKRSRYFETYRRTTPMLPSGKNCYPIY